MIEHKAEHKPEPPKRIPLTNAQAQRIAAINAAIQQVQAQFQDKMNMFAQTKGIMIMTILEYNGTPPEAVYDLSPDGMTLLLKEAPPERKDSASALRIVE